MNWENGYLAAARETRPQFTSEPDGLAAVMVVVVGSVAIQAHSCRLHGTITR